MDKQRSKGKVISALVLCFFLLVIPTRGVAQEISDEEDGVVNLLQNPSFEEGFTRCNAQKVQGWYKCADEGRVVPEISYPVGWEFWYLASGGQPEARQTGSPYDYRVSDGSLAFMGFCPWRYYRIVLKQDVHVEPNYGKAQACVDFHSWLRDVGEDEEDNPYMYNDEHPLSEGCTADNMHNCGWGVVGCTILRFAPDSGEQPIEKKVCRESPDFYSQICTAPLEVEEAGTLSLAFLVYNRYAVKTADFYIDRAMLLYEEAGGGDWSADYEGVEEADIGALEEITGTYNVVTETESPLSTVVITTTFGLGSGESGTSTPAPTSTPTPTPAPENTPTPTPTPRPGLAEVLEADGRVVYAASDKILYHEMQINYGEINNERVFPGVNQVVVRPNETISISQDIGLPALAVLQQHQEEEEAEKQKEAPPEEQIGEISIGPGTIIFIVVAIAILVFFTVANKLPEENKIRQLADKLQMKGR
jgi:hypothetical protein